MDADHLDDISRAISSSPTRRAAARLLAGGALAGAGLWGGLADSEAKKGKGKKKRKKKNKRQNSGTCTANAAQRDGQCWAWLPEPFIGTWRGTVSESDNETFYSTITLWAGMSGEIVGSESSNTCTWSMELAQISKNRQVLKFYERLTSNIGEVPCGEGTLYLQYIFGADSDHLSYTFEGQVEGSANLYHVDD
ncbi:MAG: hypothetical protein QM692_15535 [Thermomicrobiales bacterium]